MGLSIKAYIEKYGDQIGNSYWTVRKNMKALETVTMESGQVFIKETEANLALCKGFIPGKKGRKAKAIPVDPVEVE